MKKLLYLGLMSLLGFGSIALASDPIKSCSLKTKIYFVNGIDNTRKEAEFYKKLKEINDEIKELEAELNLKRCTSE